MCSPTYHLRKITIMKRKTPLLNMYYCPNDNKLEINERKNWCRFHLKFEKKKDFGAEIASIGELICSYRKFISSIMRRCSSWLSYKDGNRFYYFDMKPVYYKELVSAILIPCVFGIVLVRLAHWIEKTKLLNSLNRFVILCGRSTVPIMFMHIPLNHWKESLGYGRVGFILIGIGLPLAFTLIFNRYSVMRELFGLPDLS